MTRQHFEVLAKALRTSRPDVNIRKNSLRYKTWAECCIHLANECFINNPRFSYIKFYDACGLDTWIK